MQHNKIYKYKFLDEKKSDAFSKKLEEVFYKKYFFFCAED